MDLKKDILIIYPNLNSFSKFIGEALHGLPVTACGCWRAKTRFGANFCRVADILKLPLKRLTYGEWKTYKGYKTVIIFDALLRDDLFQILKNNNPDARFIVYKWNPGVTENWLNEMDAKGIEVYSFDIKDCERFPKMKFNQQFYPMSGTQIGNSMNTKEIQDFYFCGYNKRRFPVLRKLAEQFNDKKLSYSIIVREWSKYGLRKKTKTVDGIQMVWKETIYDEILSEVQRSKCLIDIVQKGQKGLTIRVMESLAYHKKILTNNEMLKNEPFYHPSNIFIIDENDIKGSCQHLEQFLAMPYERVDETILRSYDAQEWLRRFEHKEQSQHNLMG